MVKKKEFPPLPGWQEDRPNYELEYLRMENLKLKEQLQHVSKPTLDKNMEKDVAVLLQVSMEMKYLLEQCRSQAMLPMELGKRIDKVIKEIENYG